MRLRLELRWRRHTGLSASGRSAGAQERRGTIGTPGERVANIGGSSAASAWPMRPRGLRVRPDVDVALDTAPRTVEAPTTAAERARCRGARDWGRVSEGDADRGQAGPALAADEGAGRPARLNGRRRTYDPRVSGADPKASGRVDLAHWVILVAGVVVRRRRRAAGARGVRRPARRRSRRTATRRPGWPIGVQVAAGLVSFGTWRFVNRRNNRPFAVVLLALGILTVLVLASASYAACPDAGLSSGWSVVTRVVGLLTNNYAVDMFEAPGCETDGVPLALQFARLAQLIVLLVAATSAVTALLRTQVDRVGGALVAAALGGARRRRHVRAAAAGPGLGRRAGDARGLHLRPAGALGGPGPRGRVAGRDRRPAAARRR